MKNITRMQKQILTLLLLCSCSLMWVEPVQAGRFFGGSHAHTTPHNTPHSTSESHNPLIRPHISGSGNGDEADQSNGSIGNPSDAGSVNSGYVMLGLAGPLLFVAFRLRKFFRLRRNKSEREAEFAQQMLLQHGRTPPAADAGTAVASQPLPPVTPAPTPATAVPRMADGSDIDAFIRQIRASFLHLRTLNQAMNGEEIRNYLSPALVEKLRPGLPKNAEAVKFPILKAELLGSSQDGNGTFARLRFFGTVKLSATAPVFEFAEIWELRKASAIDNWQVVDIIREDVA